MKRLPSTIALLVSLGGPCLSPAVASPPRMEVHGRSFERSGDTREFQVGPGQVLRSGDELRFRVTASTTGHLYVVALGASGSAVVLHPLAGESLAVRQGEVVAVPADGGYLPLDERTGRETLIAFISPAPPDSPASALLRMEGAGASAASLDGSALFNDRLELVGLGNMVRPGGGELVGVSTDTIRSFLQAPK